MKAIEVTKKLGTFYLVEVDRKYSRKTKAPLRKILNGELEDCMNEAHQKEISDEGRDKLEKDLNKIFMKYYCKPYVGDNGNLRMRMVKGG